MVKYDFSTKQAIGIKGKPVKDLKSQLSGITTKALIDSCIDTKYANFLRFIERKESEEYTIYNIGTILSRVPKYANFEQLFSAGVDDIIGKGSFKYTINDIPKGLIKLCKEREIKLSNNFLQYYKENPDAYLLAYKLDYLSLNDRDILDILSYEGCSYNRDDGGRYIYYSYFNKLLNECGYTAKALLLYMDVLKTYEALTDIPHIIKKLYDYANIMKEISNKFDKYPRDFLISHRIAYSNYSRLKQEFLEQLFQNKIDKSLEYTYKDYQFIYPETIQDIKDEAVQQNNCVASYINKVLKGSCHILFLRKKDDIAKSLVTIEVRNNRIVQARRKFNNPIIEEEQIAIDKWNEKFKIEKECVA